MKNLLSVSLKIIGIIAFWKAIQAFGTVITGVGVFSALCMADTNVESIFVFSIAFAMILNFILPLLFAFYLLFRTEKVLSQLKINDEETIAFNLKKSVMYHMLIIAIGLITMIHGVGNYISVSYKTDTKTEQTTNYHSDDQSNEPTANKVVSNTHSKSRNVNYFALLEIIIGIVLLAKATDIAMKIERNFDSKTERQEALSDN